MAAIIGDAKIKVTLDTDAARREVERLSKTDVPDGAGGRGPREARPGTLTQSPVTRDRVGHKTFDPARTATFQASGEANILKAAKAAWAVYMVKQVIDAVEASPKFASLVKGFIGAKAGSPTLDYLSDEITLIKSKLDAFMETKDEMAQFGRAALMLGQHPTVEGTMDMWSFLLNLNMRQDLMNKRVDKELDKQIMEKIGESARIAMNR